MAPEMAAINGLYQLIGDDTGHVLITDVIVEDMTVPVIEPIGEGEVGSGAVIIDGGDRWDHGDIVDGVNVDGWQYLEQMVGFALDGALNGAPNDILAIGATTDNPEDTSVAAMIPRARFG